MWSTYTQVARSPTHSFRILRLLYDQTEPCEQAWTTALLFKRMSTERPVESGCILRQTKCRPLPEPPVRRSQQFLHCPTNPPHANGKKGIQIISPALKMWILPKSNPLQDRHPPPSPFVLPHVHLHVSHILLKPASRSKLNSNFNHLGRKLDQIFLEVYSMG